MAPIKPSLEILLSESKEKKLLFLGRQGIFTVEEVERFLKKFDLSMTSNYEEGVVGVIEHHTLNPIEEDISCLAYDDEIPLYKLLDFEKLISQSINDDELLMGIKLANDQERIFRLLGNSHISDELFVKLLSMYQWHEDEDDSREDRDVIMYTLRRFIEIKPNEEDLLYSALTLKRLAREATDPKLLNVLIRFPNIVFLQKGKQKITLRESIASNPHIDENVITRLISLRDSGVDMYLACNDTVSLPLLQKFASKHIEQIDEALASNVNIDDEIFDSLLEKNDNVIKLLFWYQPIDNKRYDAIKEKMVDNELLSELGNNRTLAKEVVEQLLEEADHMLLSNFSANDALDGKVLGSIFEKGIFETYKYLAKNPSTPIEILNTLYLDHQNDTDILIALSYNVSTPVEILKELYEKDEFEITKGIASNASVPLEILNILKIDTRLRNELTANQTFVASITQKLGL
jgi:hypothetical protein